MEADPPQAGLLEAGEESPVLDVVHVGGVAVSIREDRFGNLVLPLRKPFLFSMALQVRQFTEQLIRHIDPAHLVGLGASHATAHDVIPDVEELAVEVDIRPLQAGEFPGAQARMDRTQKERIVLRRSPFHGLEEQRHFFPGQRLDLFVDNGACL